MDKLKFEYNRLNALDIDKVTVDSPLKEACFKESGTPQRFYKLNRNVFSDVASDTEVKNIIASLDQQNRWLVKHAYISHPYIGDGKNKEQSDKYSTTRVGDETDTSVYPDSSEKEYISTREYIRNMNLLISYLKSKNP